MDEEVCKAQFSVDVPDFEREELLGEDEEGATTSFPEAGAAPVALTPSNVLFEVADLSFTDISWDTISELDKVDTTSIVKQEQHDSFSKDSNKLPKDSPGVPIPQLNSPIKPKSILKKSKGSSLGYVVSAEDLTFPSQAFINGCGMGFCSSFSEMQREVGLLAWKLIPVLQSIDSEILELANSSPEHTRLLAQHLDNKSLDCFDAEGLGFSDEDINRFKTLKKTYGSPCSEGGRLYFGKKLLLFLDDHCKLFQIFTRRFVMRSIMPALNVLEDHYVLFVRPTINHSKCGCLSNPLLKFPQVLQNLPIKLLAPYYSLRHSLTTPHGAATQKLALLGRGRRPWRVVIILDQLLYPGLDMTSFMSVQCEILIQEKMDLVVAKTVIEQHPRYATDSVLFVVLASFGSLVQGCLDGEEDQTSSGSGSCARARFERCSLQSDDGEEEVLPEEDEPMEDCVESMDTEDALEESMDSTADILGQALATSAIESALTLWRSVLCSSRDSDVVFVALPALAASNSRGPKLLFRHPASPHQACAKQHSGPSCRAVLLQACALYSRWCYLQNFSTGRLRDFSLLTASHVGPLYQPSIADLTSYLNSLVDTVRKDATLEQSYERPAQLRMPQVRRFSRVLLVAEEASATPLQKLLQQHWQHFQADVVLVPEWNPTYAESVLSSLDSNEGVLLALVPSWLSPSAVTKHYFKSSDVPLFKAKPCSEARLPGVEDAEKGIQLIKTFMKAVEAIAGDCVSVVLLPALPVHCCIDDFTSAVSEAVIPPGLLLLEIAQVKFSRVLASYRSFSSAVCREALVSLSKESLHSDALLTFAKKTEDLTLNDKYKAFGSQNTCTDELCSQGNNLPDVTATLFGLFCRMLHEIIFTAMSGFLLQPLPDIEELNFCDTYFQLRHLADLSSKSHRFKKVVMVGDAAARSRICKELGSEERIQFLPTPSFSDSSLPELLESFRLEPSNVLVLFLLDVTLFAEKEVYPDCLTKKCPEKILRCYLSSSVDWEDYSTVQALVTEKLKEVLHYLQLMKQCLPHQSSVLLLPVAPERLLLQTEAKSYWNHTLLHATFWLPGSGNAMAYGNPEHWSTLYHTLAQELNRPQYLIDPGMGALFANLKKDLEPQLSCSSNPRLYSEDEFPERKVWRRLCMDLLNKAFKLVFPVVGILEEDLNKAEVVKNTTDPEWEIKPKEKDSHIPSSANSTSSNAGPGSVVRPSPASSPVSNRASLTPSPMKELESPGPASGFLGAPREVVIEGGHVELPLSFVQALLAPFEPLTEVVRAEPRGYQVTLPDTIRTSLLVALLHNFRCCFVHVTITVLNFECQTLPQCPAREKLRLQQLLIPKLKFFATSCDSKYTQNIRIDDAFLKRREEERDYVEGLDATLPYLHRELQYLHFHQQQPIRDDKVLVLVVSETAEDSDCLHFTLAGSMRDSARFPVGPGTASLTFVTRDSKQTQGNVVLGTVRFVLSLVRSGADPSCVQLIVIEELKAIMTSQNKGPLLEILAWLQAAKSAVRPVLVSRRSCLQELSGGNALFRCQLRLITRSETGAAVIQEYDPASLPRVVISGLPPQRSFSAKPGPRATASPRPAAPPFGPWPRLGLNSGSRPLYPVRHNVHPPSATSGSRPLSAGPCVPPAMHGPNAHAPTAMGCEIRSPTSSRGVFGMGSGVNSQALGPGRHHSIPGPGVRPPISRPGIRPPNSGPGTRPFNSGPGVRTPISGPGVRTPISGPGVRPLISGPGIRPLNSGPGVRPLISGPGVRPPVSGPYVRLPPPGPGGRPSTPGSDFRPPQMGPNTCAPMTGPGLSGSGVYPPVGHNANARPSMNMHSSPTIKYGSRPHLGPNVGPPSSSGHYLASARQGFQRPLGPRVRPPTGNIPPPPPPATSGGDPYGGVSARPSKSFGDSSYGGISRGSQSNISSTVASGWNSSFSSTERDAVGGYEKYDPFSEDSSDSKKRYRSRSQSPSQGFLRSSSSVGTEVGKKFRPDGDSREFPGSTSLAPEEESRMRSELEVEFKAYETNPELHPNYSEYREVFSNLCEGKRGHKEGVSLEQEWNNMWLRVLADLMEKKFSERKTALIAGKTNRASRITTQTNSSTSGGRSTSYSYAEETNKSKWVVGNSRGYYGEKPTYDYSAGYGGNKKSYSTSAGYGGAQHQGGRHQVGLGISSYGSSSSYQSWDAGKDCESRPHCNSSRSDETPCHGGEQQWHDPDLDPATLAERTRGLSTMEVAVLIKQLLKDKNIPQPEQVFKKIYSAVSDLHLKYVEEQLSL